MVTSSRPVFGAAPVGAVLITLTPTNPWASVVVGGVPPDMEVTVRLAAGVKVTAAFPNGTLTISAE
jgi:hypothetical protein